MPLLLLWDTAWGLLLGNRARDTKLFCSFVFGDVGLFASLEGAAGAVREVSEPG